MLDREKVIRALKCNADTFVRCIENEYDEDCPYCLKDFDGCFIGCDIETLFRDAIELLKEQEAVEPKTENAVYDIGSWWFICGVCKKPIDKTDKFCRHCGRSVKWE